MIENISISEKGNKVLELGDIIRANTTLNHREGVEESQDGGYFVKVISLQILELKGTLNGIYKKIYQQICFSFENSINKECSKKQEANDMNCLIKLLWGQLVSHRKSSSLEESTRIFF